MQGLFKKSRLPQTATASSTTVPDYILAFRTMTTLLSKIQQTDASTTIIEDLPARGLPERQEVRILSALSSFLVMDNEVVAVTSKQPSGDKDGVEVIISTHNDESLLIHPPQSSTFVGGVVRYLLSKNPRSENTMTTTGPVFMEPTPPPDFVNVDQWIKEFRFNIPLSSHVWVLTKMLNDKNLEMSSYYYYITFACILKIHRRFHHPLSMPFFDALTTIKKVTFSDELISQNMDKAKESRLDRAVLKWVLDALALEEQAAFPVLVKMAVDDSEKNEKFKLYCTNTCQEFHNFLCHLLTSFSGCLIAIDKHAKKNQQLTYNRATEEIRHEVTSTVMYALALQDMVASPAFSQHLKNIHLPLKSLLSDMMEARKTGDLLEVQDYDELRAVQPNALRDHRVLALPEAYEEWLKLVLTHYEAANILFKYVTSKNSASGRRAIEMQILDTPLVSPLMLPWLQLFSSGSSGSQGPTTYYIPDIQDSPEEPSNAQILIFLESGVKMDIPRTTGKIIEYRKRFLRFDFKAQSDAGIDKLHKSIDKLIQTLSNSKTDWQAWNSASKEITDLLEDMKMPKALIERLRNSVDKIFEALLTSLSFFAYLQAMIFNGCDHCEVSLAGLLAFSLTGYGNLDASIKNIVQSLVGYGRVIGVSKRCCPVCRSILSKLLPKEVPFIVRGSHNTFFPCSLPIWLPKKIADEMILEVGLKLRKELVDLMARSGLYRPRPKSSGSRRLSLDSSEGDRENFISPQSIKTMKESIVFHTAKKGKEVKNWK